MRIWLNVFDATCLTQMWDGAGVSQQFVFSQEPTLSPQLFRSHILKNKITSEINIGVSIWLLIND